MRRFGHPRTVTITALWVFLLGMWNVWRAVEVSNRLGLLLELGSTLDPRIRLGMAVVWAVLFIVLAALLWKGRSAVRRLLPLSLLLYALYRLSLMAFFMPAPAARRGWPTIAVFYIAALGWTLWVLYRPANEHVWETANRRNEETANKAANEAKTNDEK